MGAAMNVAVFNVPPSFPLSVAMLEQFSGRYTLDKGYLHMQFNELQELLDWMGEKNTTQVLINRVVNDLKNKGICVLHTKRIVIKDTEWCAKVKVLDWTTIKFPKVSNE